MNIQWYPGHMAKTRKILAENLGLIDVVIELLDARIPQSSHNKEIDKLIRTKPRIIALNKSDLADANINREWNYWFNSNGYICIIIDSIRGNGIIELISKIREIMRPEQEKDKLRGIQFKPIRTMVVGIPNVGKSAFINKIAGRASAVTGDRPGVTRGKQWIRLNEEIELLDTPGILQPKFDNPETGLNLAFTGAIKDDIYDITEAAAILAGKLFKLYPEDFSKRYKLNEVDGTSGEMLLEKIGKNRGCIISGGTVDIHRISSILLDEFRGGKIGRISLEIPVTVKDRTGGSCFE